MSRVDVLDDILEMFIKMAIHDIDKSDNITRKENEATQIPDGVKT